ncbi:MAG: DUF1553 domain-containing protein [Planctomycetes bacterium]|nr:DUF1553 domain-containing protein [Planctomycetota bacterium]
MHPIFKISIALAVSCLGWITTAVAGEEPKATATRLTFEKDVLPIFKARCVRCHAGAEPAGELSLTKRRDLLRGGKSGPAMRLAAAESSLIWEKLAGNAMPKGGPPLSAEEKKSIRQWINDGAPSDTEKDDDAVEAEGDSPGRAGTHWSFLPPTRPGIPKVATAGRVRTPIDAFVLAQLEARNLTLSNDASREVLLRRAYFDLIGLPPTPDEVQSFLDDTEESAFERVIERLLASPHYGERWGRYWLDLAGYAESAGVLSEDRPIPNMFRYRDYVCRSFNSDKPYDRFLQEQIAGDELTDYWTAYATLDRLPEQVIEGVTATGFLRCAADSSRPDFSTIKNADAQYFYPTINDTLQIVASSTLGLTLQCARCHSHKYDPIPQTEFYRLQAVFMSAFRPKQWIPQMERRLFVATAKEQQAAQEHNARLDAEIARLQAEIATLRNEFKQKLFQERLAELPESIRADVQTALGKPGDQRSEVEKYLAEKFQPSLAPDDATLDKQLPAKYPAYKAGLKERTAAIAQQQSRRQGFDEIRATYDLPGPVTTPFLRRGDALTPGAAVEPGVLSALQTPVSFQWQAPVPDAKTSGRRLAFARWLTQPNHPLTARVMVNRIWLHHLGEGIVSTPEDFGALGAAPSHPQLLDWLAREFVDSGWSIKHMHRLIMTSSVYRQASAVVPAEHTQALQVDPENRLLWRQRLRRLDAEALRDALLDVSGLLDRSLYGRSIPVARRPDGDVTIADGQNDRRRSIYVQVLRGNPLTLLHLYDQPVMETNCTRRSSSTVAPQALALLNSEISAKYANAFAERILRQAPDSIWGRAVQTAWQRAATQEEKGWLEQFAGEQQSRYVTQGLTPDAARRQALNDICQMLLVANEFVYVD